MNDIDLEKYYQKGGTYVIPIEIMNQIIGEKENLIKYLEDKIKIEKDAKEFTDKVLQESSAYESGLIDAYQDILERAKSGKYE